MRSFKGYMKSDEVRDQVCKHMESLGYELPVFGLRRHLILFHENKRITGTPPEDFVSFETDFPRYKELTPEEFLRLTPADVQEEKKRVFDIEPGDLVFVRDRKVDKWVLDHFLSLHSLKYKCIKHSWFYIKKYAPELKKYIESTDDIPGAFGRDDTFEDEV